MAHRRSVAILVVGLTSLALAGSALAASITIRVEGKTQTIFGALPVKADAGNAQQALEVASVLGEFHYGLTVSSFGTYVSQIGKYAGTGASGWVFKVNGVSPPVGADQVVLADGDEVLWYWATFTAEGGPRTLTLRADTRPNCYVVAARDDAGGGLPVTEQLPAPSTRCFVRRCPGQAGIARDAIPIEDLGHREPRIDSGHGEPACGALCEELRRHRPESIQTAARRLVSGDDVA